MDAERDLAFYSDAILPSDDDEPEDIPQVTLKLLGDFPEPLTEPQRRAVQHYVSQQVREFELVRHQVAIVELGYLALLRVVKRLRKEQAKLQASLDAPETKAKSPTTVLPSSGNADLPATPSSSTTETNNTTASAAKTPAAAAAAAAGVNASKESSTAPKRRPGGVLLRSSVFSGLQRVLQAAKTEQHDEKAEQLARQRERIAKESRLHLLSQDLATQEALLEPLQRKYARAVALGEEAAAKAAPLLELLEDMWRLEALYPSRFSMQATGALEPLMWSTRNGASGVEGDDGDAEAGEEDVEGDDDEERAGEAQGKGKKKRKAVAFAIPFTPAQYSGAVEDAVRAQVEDVIDEYLAYRARIDPVLYELEQAQQAAKAHRVDVLMEAIARTDAEAGVGVLGNAAAVAAGEPLPPTASTGKSAGQLLHISSSDEDEEDVAPHVAGMEAADKDRQDREHIRTALTALDDFEDA